MQFSPSLVEKYFERNYKRHALAEEMEVKIKRLRGCFTEAILPFPNPELIAAWEDIPNHTPKNLPTSMKTGMVVLQAPPSSPNWLAFDLDDTTSSESPLSNGSWVSSEDAKTASSDEVAHQPPETPNTSNDEMSQCDPNPCSEKQPFEDDVFQPTESKSPSSTSSFESLASSGQTSLLPVGFVNMVNQWSLEYQSRGLDAFVEELIAFGVVSFGTAPLAARIARGVIKKVSRQSNVEGKNLEHNLRFAAVTSFKNCWESSDDWTTSPYPRSAGIASLIGALFDEKISTAKDIHLCLSHLLDGEKGFDRLYAIHALLVRANDKLCKSRNILALMEFKRKIAIKDEESGEYIWVTTPDSKAILTDILTTIQRWTASQAVRREKSRRITADSNTVRTRAVGPRLRGEPPAQ